MTRRVESHAVILCVPFDAHFLLVPVLWRVGLAAAAFVEGNESLPMQLD